MCDKLKVCCVVFNAIVLVHLLALPLKLIQPFLKGCVLALLRCELSGYLQREVLFPILECCLENSHYSLSMLTVVLVFYVVWFYCNGINPNPFDDNYLTANNPDDYAHDDMIESLTLLELEEKVKPCIGTNWKQLARELGFMETAIDDIELEGGPTEQVHQFFLAWHRREGNGATKELLVYALRKAELDEAKIKALQKSGIQRPINNVDAPSLEPKPLMLQAPPPTKLTGLNFIAEKSNCESKDLPWNGLMLTVPMDSFPSLTVRVSSGGNVSLPANTELVSALYSITFNDKADPGFDLSVGFQHSAFIVKESACGRLQTVVAKLPQTSLPYQLRICTDKTSTGVSEEAGNVRLPCLSSQHGYLIGLVKPSTRYWVFAGGNIRSKYYLRAVVHSLSNRLSSEYEMHIIVVKHLDPFIQLVDTRYPAERFVSYGEVTLCLQEHSPKPFYQSGLSFTSVSPLCKEWKASFSTPTVIPRSKLESPESYTKSGVQLPKVTIIFKRDSDEGVARDIPTLECKIKLSGTASCPYLTLAPIQR